MLGESRKSLTHHGFDQPRHVTEAGVDSHRRRTDLAGFFRPDASLIAATDLLGTTAMLALGWLVLFDFAQGVSRQPGAILALISMAVIAFAVADYRPLRGASLFSRTFTS